MALIDVTPYQLKTARYTIDAAANDLKTFEKDYFYYCNRLYDEGEHVLATIESNIFKCKKEVERIAKEKEKICDRLKIDTEELARCRPPYTEIVKWKDSEGNEHSRSELRDPDGPKREALKVEIEKLQELLIKIDAAFETMASYLEEQRVAKGMIGSAKNQIQAAISNTKETIENAIKRYDEASEILSEASFVVEEYNSIRIGGHADIDPLPKLHYYQGRTSIYRETLGGTAEINAIGAQVDNEEKLDFMPPMHLKSLEEFEIYIGDLCQKHMHFKLRIKKDLIHFDFKTSFMEINPVLRRYGIANSLNDFGFKVLDVEDCYVYER